MLLLTCDHIPVYVRLQISKSERVTLISELKLASVVDSSPENSLRQVSKSERLILPSQLASPWNFMGQLGEEVTEEEGVGVLVLVGVLLGLIKVGVGVLIGA